MKYLKTLGLAVIAAAALTVLVGSVNAQATVLCTSTATPCTSPFFAGSRIPFALSTSVTWSTTEGETFETCTKSSLELEVTQTGSATTTTAGTIRLLTWGTCTLPPVPKLITLGGGFEIHHIAGTDNGTITATSEISVTMQYILFGCRYGATKGTDLGVFTGGNPATVEINAVTERLIGSELTCPETIQWSSSYAVSNKEIPALFVEPS